GCNDADFTGFTAGNVAWIERGTCSIKLKAYNAQQHNASAVVVVAHNTVAPSVTADDGAVPAVTIPTVMISGPAGSDIVAGGLDKARLNPNGANYGDSLSTFSSRGPGRGNLPGGLVLKPDVTAPGQTITSTLSCYDGSGGCLGNE